MGSLKGGDMRLDRNDQLVLKLVGQMGETTPLQLADEAKKLGKRLRLDLIHHCLIHLLDAGLVQKRQQIALTGSFPNSLNEINLYSIKRKGIEFLKQVDQNGGETQLLTSPHGFGIFVL
jgi:hypothetical protein